MEQNNFRISGMDAIKEAMDKYSSAAGDYFGIKNDGETKRVRFAHGDDSDLDIFVVHKVKIAGKDKNVLCLSVLNQPCPFCQAGLKPAVKIFISLLDTTDNKMKVWERGKTEIPNIVGLVQRYGRLDSRMYDIQRHGKPNSTDTTYQYFPLDPQPGMGDLTRESVIGDGAYIMQKNAEEMKTLLNEISAPSQYGSTPQGGGAPGGTPGKMF